VSGERVHDRCACGSILSSGRRFARGDEAPLAFTLQGTERVYERARPFRIDHIDLDLAIDHAARSFSGTAELDVTRVDRSATTLVLDAVDLDDLEVRVASRRAGARKAGAPRHCEHAYDGNTLRIPVATAVERLRVRVRYRARPRRGMYFLAPDELVPGRPTQVWTQCQDEDARRLFPCHDKPHIRQTMEIRVRVEPGWFVLSNGDLVSSRADQRRGRFHYRMRQAQPSYLFTVVAGRFAVIDDAVGSLPVRYYVPPGRQADGRRTFARTPDMIRLFERRTGVAYPWTKYAQVVVSDFIFGGMENTGATTMYEHVLLDERAALDITSDDLIAHELAHQWFGDLVTCRDWSHAWLNEGFATFMEHVWREHHLGRDEYFQGLREDLRAYLTEAESRYQRPVVCADYDAPIDIFDRHLYEKGGLVLHALRCELGDAAFWRGVGGYLRSHGGGVVETNDLLRALEEASGKGLEQIFEQSLHRAGHPQLDVDVQHEGELLTVTVKQTLSAGARPFALDLELDVCHGGGGRRRRGASVTRHVRRVERASHTFALPAPSRPRFVVVDPEMRVVGRLTVTAPADMLREQLATAPTARGRALAAEALARRDEPATIRALGVTLRDARAFWGVRAAAAAALGSIRSPEALDELTSAVGARHSKVRRATAAALGSFKTARAVELLAPLARGDRSLLVAAAACRALGETRQREAFEVLVELIDRPSWADTLRCAALDGLGRLRDDRGVEPLRERTRYGVPQRVRRAAVEALVKLSPTRRTRELLEELLDDTDPYLRVAVADALGELGDPKARPALRRVLDRDLDGRVRRRVREVLRDLAAKGRREMRRVLDELEHLRRAHDEVKARLSKLEQRLDDGKRRTRARRPRPR
jgi:aminopeptidase N